MIAKKDVKILIYFVEDDYLHSEDTITEMIFAYEKLASRFSKDLFYVQLIILIYIKKMKCYKNFLGEKYHWRKVSESLVTFMTSKKIIKKIGIIFRKDGY